MAPQPRLLGGSLAEEARAIAQTTAAGALRVFAGFAGDLRDFSFSGPRARQATIAALAVVLSALVALVLHMPNAWWAAISGFISTQATRPASLRKAVLRNIGTVCGALLAVVSIGWLAYDPPACCLVLFGVATVGILGQLLSRYAYAWLFTAITFALVVLMSLETPRAAFDIATERTIEVLIGTTVAVILAVLLADEGDAADSAAPPGWHDLFGARWPAVLHALRSGTVLAMLPVVWSWFYVPGVSTMATTAASILAVPTLADNPLDLGARIVEKSTQRLLGCVIGGGLAMLLLGILPDLLAAWVAALFGGIWLFAYVQGSTRGVGYVGMQAALAFILMMIQGDGPPDSLVPALNRFAGIVFGLLTLVIVSLIVQPSIESAVADGVVFHPRG